MRWLFTFLCIGALCAVPVLGCGDAKPECRTDDDCSDGNSCTDDRCRGGSCDFPNRPDGTSCGGWLGGLCSGFGGSPECRSGECRCVGEQIFNE